MPALFTGSTGVNMQAIDFFIVDHLQYVRMPRNEQLRWVSVNFTLYVRAVPIGITADMGHPNIHFFAIKPEVFGVHQSHILAINITIHAFQWFKRSQLIGQFERTEIAGMPYFITIGKMFKYGVVKVAMRVGNKANFCHALD